MGRQKLILVSPWFKTKLGDKGMLGRVVVAEKIAKSFAASPKNKA